MNRASCIPAETGALTAAGCRAPIIMSEKTHGINDPSATLAAQIEQDAEELRPMLTAAAVRILNDSESSQDIVQEAFLKVLQSGGAFEGASSLKTYLYRIVINKCIDTHRKKKRWNKLMALFAAEKKLENDTRPDDGDLKKTVRRLFEKIPDTFRVPLILAEANGMSYEEIADSLGISLNTVRTRIYRCREKLRKKFEKTGGLL